MAYHRSSLHEAVRHQRHRQRQCPFVPLWVGLFLCAALSFSIRTDIGAGGEARRLLSTRLATQGAWKDDGSLALGGSGESLSWLGGPWLTAVAGDGEVRGLLVGSLRLSQWRASPCPPPATLPAFATALLGSRGVGGAPCPASSPLSSSPYGPALASPGGPLDGAFSPLPTPLQLSLKSAAGSTTAHLPTSFSVPLPPDSTPAAGVLGALGEAQWVDGATQALEGGSVSIIPSLQRWFRVRVRLDVEDGGAFVGGVDTCVVRLSPWGEWDSYWGAVGDVGCIIGAVLLCLGVGRECVGCFRGVWGGREGGDGGSGGVGGPWQKAVRGVCLVRKFTPYTHPHSSSSSSSSGGSIGAPTLSKVPPSPPPPHPVSAWLWEGLGWVLDIGTALTLATLVITASVWDGEVGRLNAWAAQAVSPSSSSSSSTASPLNPGLEGLLLLHTHTEAACTAQRTWLSAATAATLFLTIKALRLLSLTPRLTFLAQAATASLPDASHFATFFALAMLAFGVYARGVFGATAEDFSTLGSSLLSLVKMMVFDYSYGPMVAGGGALAAAFFVCFMLLVTHVLLWSFLGIVLEAFSMARMGGGEKCPHAPSLVQDAGAGVVGVGVWGRAALKEWGGGREGGGVARPSGDHSPLPPLHLITPWKRREIFLGVLEKFEAALEMVASEVASAAAAAAAGVSGATPVVAAATEAAIADALPSGGISGVGMGASSGDGSIIANSAPLPHPPEKVKGSGGGPCGGAYITVTQLSSLLGVKPSVVARAVQAILRGDDLCGEYSDALFSVAVGEKVVGGEGVIEVVEASSGSGSDEGRGHGEDSGSSSSSSNSREGGSRMIAIRGMLIRTTAGTATASSHE